MSELKHGLLALSEEEVQSIESWLSGQIDIVTTTWSEGQWGVNAITWLDSDKEASLERVFGQTDRQLVTHFEMAGKEGKNGDYSTAASGGFDDRYRQTAKELVDIGMTDTIIRPSAEFNLDWSGDYPNNPDNYASAFAQVVREMNAVEGTNFTYLYSPARNKIGVADECWPLDAPEWPADADTPHIAPSFYDDSWHYQDSDGNQKPQDEITNSDRQNAWQNERDKLDTWQEFADQRGSPGLCSPEWGLVGIDEPHPGGGDNPYFIEQVFNYMQSNDWLFQACWNQAQAGASGHTKEVFEGDVSTDNPESKTKFKEMVSLSVDSTDEQDSSDYGGYDQPERGTLEWHEPVNGNFVSIEADIVDLARRVSELESDN